MPTGSDNDLYEAFDALLDELTDLEKRASAVFTLARDTRRLVLQSAQERRRESFNRADVVYIPTPLALMETPSEDESAASGF